MPQRDGPKTDNIFTKAVLGVVAKKQRMADMPRSRIAPFMQEQVSRDKLRTMLTEGNEDFRKQFLADHGRQQMLDLFKGKEGSNG